MAEWNMVPASTISNKDFSVLPVPIDITLLSEKLFCRVEWPWSIEPSRWKRSARRMSRV
jgi:hypothetical protein